MKDYADQNRRRGSARRRQAERKTKSPEREDSQRSSFALSRSLKMNWMKDIVWMLRQRRQLQVSIAVFITAVVLTTALLVTSLDNRIAPNVFVAGIAVGGLQDEEAYRAIQTRWTDVDIMLTYADEIFIASASSLGMIIDMDATLASVQRAGIWDSLWGHRIQPSFDVNESVFQNYLLTLAQDFDRSPQNARYTVENGAVVGVDGQPGRRLDVIATSRRVLDQSNDFENIRTIPLQVEILSPRLSDPEIYLDDVREIAALSLAIHGYDPFLDEHTVWSTTPEVIVSWLTADIDGLHIDATTFTPFAEGISETIRDSDNGERYINAQASLRLIEGALRDREETVQVRIQYRPITYTVVSGDTAFRIARKTGLPYFLIEQANTGRDLSVLSPGDRLNIPSRDATIPLPPVADKRIVVDLDRQSLAAYENGTEAFSWRISSGMTEAPTYPGVFQILNQEEVAYGSSYTLCDDTGCGEWELYWFMGLYEVVPGLVNGFHGAVLLPNGAYLGGNQVGVPYTLGCVMSRDDQAKILYDWAEVGTVVEIISSDFEPLSPLANQAFSAPA